MLLVALQATFFGLTVVTPQPKVYSHSAYYAIQPGDAPDYYKLYQQVNGTYVESGKDCDIGKRALSDVGNGTLVAHMNGLGVTGVAGKYWIYSFAQFVTDGTDQFQRYFLTQNTEAAKKQTTGFIPDMLATPDPNVNVYKLTADNTIIAPGNGYIPLKSMKVNGVYPETYDTGGAKLTGNEGVTFDYIVEPTASDENYYKFTIGGVLRMWCCMLKTTPDDYGDSSKTTPLYKHSYTLSGKQIFNAGDILAQCGNTATPKVTRTASATKSSTYTLVTVSRSADGSSWEKIPIKDFYYPVSK